MDTPVEIPLASPFALMSSETAKAIIQRAAALDLPSRRCSPLSVQRTPGGLADDDDDGF